MKNIYSTNDTSNKECSLSCIADAGMFLKLFISMWRNLGEIRLGTNFINIYIPVQKYINLSDLKIGIQKIISKKNSWHWQIQTTQHNPSMHFDQNLIIEYRIFLKTRISWTNFGSDICYPGITVKNCLLYGLHWEFLRSFIIFECFCLTYKRNAKTKNLYTRTI